MKNELIKGIIFSSAGSFWWGIIGVFYFKHVSFAGPVELVIHRTIWTAFIFSPLDNLIEEYSLSLLSIDIQFTSSNKVTLERLVNLL